ncbi:hypothetical protein B0H65DRAFT_9363 [Neurospora tetraspora]|uniref:Secreted protein n=1 Tax=Neurospora tetraspora TaxID=94610 RepID=A0AAE0MW19_9PEZI|nr:hypothetical protein B0H65DRAFT_9363 [Neurospora tetraspora]
MTLSHPALLFFSSSFPVLQFCLNCWATQLPPTSRRTTSKTAAAFLTLWCNRNTTLASRCTITVIPNRNDHPHQIRNTVRPALDHQASLSVTFHPRLTCRPQRSQTTNRPFSLAQNPPLLANPSMSFRGKFYSPPRT